MKYSVRLIIVSLIFTSVIFFTGCNEVSKSSGISELTVNIGKTFDDVKTEHPSYEFLHLGGHDCYFESFGSSDASFAYVFYGTQSGPGIEEVSAEHGKDLKCGGIYTTVDSIFPSTKDESASVEDFLNSIGISYNNSEEVHYWNGWIFFDYEGYSISINTGFIGETAYEVPKATVEKGQPLIIEDKEILDFNYKLAERMMNS